MGGGASNKIYSLSKSNIALWEFIGMTTESRYAHISLLIPKTFLDSCNSTTIEHVNFNFDDEFGDKNEDDTTTEEFTTTKEIYTTEETNTT